MLPAEGHAAEKADTRPELPQKDKSDTSMECETNKTALKDEDTKRANAQQTIDMPEHNLQEHEKQIRSYTLRSTAVKDSTGEEKSQLYSSMQGMLRKIYTNAH